MFKEERKQSDCFTPNGGRSHLGRGTDYKAGSVSGQSATPTRMRDQYGGLLVFSFFFINIFSISEVRAQFCVLTSPYLENEELNWSWAGCLRRIVFIQPLLINIEIGAFRARVEQSSILAVDLTGTNLLFNPSSSTLLGIWDLGEKRG